MSRPRQARQRLSTLLVAMLVVLAVGAPASVAAAGCTKLAALDDISRMDDVELAEYATRGCNVQLVSYEKLFVPFDADGKPGAPIRLTHRQTARKAAAGSDQLVSALGSDTDDHGLYLSISASRNTGTSYCSNWSFSGHFRWNNAPPPSKNIGYDFWGMTWAGNQALTSTGAAYGIDNVGTSRTHPVADTTPNEGIAWRFREWPSSPGVWVRYGYSGQSVRQRTCVGASGNVSIRYIHTFSDATYSVSVGAGSPGSISVSPSSNQWSFSQTANFSY